MRLLWTIHCLTLVLYRTPFGLSQQTAEEELKTPTTRTGHVDVLDADTLKYYLEAPKEDFDVVVLYYASWCTNCKALSPIYAQIASILSAGTTDSNVIMSYFDCEGDFDRATLCSQAGITHYPTIHFYSFSGQRLSRTEPKHISKFPGNWQQGEAILDWIRVMSFLSRWHRAAWGQRLRGWLFGKKDKDSVAEKNLPVGVPQAAAAERKVQGLQEEWDTMRDLAVRTSSFLDAVLFPVATTGIDSSMTDANANGGTYADVFGQLTKSNGWHDKTNATAAVLRMCIMEAALDVCERLNLRVAENWLEEHPITNVATITDTELALFENDTKSTIQQKEPFCMIAKDCVIKDFQPPECRPDKCPFSDPTACRYLTACLTSALQEEYAAAMGLTLPSSTSGSGTLETPQPKGQTGKPKEKKGWGIF